MNVRVVFTSLHKVMICFLLLVISSCTHNDNTIGDRAAESWENFVRKDLVGSWTPSVIEIKPLLGKPIFSLDYPKIPQCTEDQLLLNIDYSGSFTHLLEGCKSSTIDFTWSHIIMRLSFTLQDGRVITPLLLGKSSTHLELAVPVKTLMPYIQEIYPEINDLEKDILDLLFVSVILVK